MKIKGFLRARATMLQRRGHFAIYGIMEDKRETDMVVASVLTDSREDLTARAAQAWRDKNRTRMPDNCWLQFRRTT